MIDLVKIRQSEIYMSLLNLNQINVPISGSISKVSRVIASFYFMSMVQPETFSQWASIVLILQYSIFLQLGVPFSMTREISIAIGQNAQDKNVLIARTAIINFLFASVILYILLIISDYEALLSLTFWYVTISHLSALFIAQARSQFKNLNVVAAFITESLIILVGIFFYFNVDNPIESFIQILSLAALATCFVCFPSKDILSKIKISLINIYKTELSLIRLGIPLLLFSFMLLFKDTWDLIAIQYLSPSSYNTYSSVFIFGNGVRIFGALVAMLFLPIMARQFGASGSVQSQALLKDFKMYRLYIGYVFILCLLFFYPLLNFLTEYILEEYKHLIDIIYFRTTAIFLGLNALPYLHLFNTIRKSRISILIILFSTVSSMLSAFIISNFLAMEIVFTISHLITSIMILILCRYYLNNLLKEKIIS